jgi:hypothetical protein
MEQHIFQRQKLSEQQIVDGNVETRSATTLRTANIEKIYYTIWNTQSHP